MNRDPGVADAWSEAGTLHLLLDNAIEAIEAGRRRIHDWAAPLGLAPRQANRLEVVFEEIVSNIVRHGFDRGSGQRIHIVLAADGGSIALTAEDDGAPFDPLATPAPPPFSDLATAAIGGLGIEMIRRFCADLAYERLSETPVPLPAERAFRPVNRLRLVIAR